MFLALSGSLFGTLASAADCKAIRAEYEGKTLYLQYNLWNHDGEAKWVNFMREGDFVDLGTPVLVKKLKSDSAVLQVVGQKRQVELDLEDVLPDCGTVLSRMLGSSAPSLERLSDKDRDGIKRGALSVGMSRRAIFMAVGYPPYRYEKPFSNQTANNHDVTANELTYAGSTFDLVVVKFENDIATSIDD